MKDARSPQAQALRRHLEQLKALRGSGGDPPKRLTELKAWQSQRLARTYADMQAQARYRDATRFFLEDLYGPKDFSSRDEEMMRILPMMMRVLPASAVETAALAIELEAVSEDLDQRLAAALPAGPIDARTYGQAYRESSTRAEREHQIDLIVAAGRRLDALVSKSLVAGMLKLMRQPARIAGLADFQEFLERGFVAFRAMDGADDFLAVLRARESAILNRLFSAAPEPFSI